MTDTMLPANQTQQTMSSREIAELIGKQVGHVHRDIASMLAQIDHPNLDHLIERDGRGYIHQYHLPRRECEILVTGYDVRRRAAVIDRWITLETKQPPIDALPSPTQLAWMVIKAEEEKEAALAEAKRLNDVCNTVTRQFVEGETPARFCMQLNGVNTQQVQKWLADRGHLISEGRKGYRPSCHTRDQYFKLHTSEKNGHEFYQCFLTNKGCRWLYKKYLDGKLPMKAGWDGQFIHGLFEKCISKSNVAYLPVRAEANQQRA